MQTNCWIIYSLWPFGFLKWNKITKGKKRINENINNPTETIIILSNIALATKAQLQRQNKMKQRKSKTDYE